MNTASHRGRTTCLVVIVLLAAVALGLFGWRMVEARQAEARLAEQQTQLGQQWQQELQVRTQELLRMLAAPIAWAVRAPIANKDLVPINALFDELAREPNLRELLLLDNQGQVLLATNKARLNAPLGDDIPAPGRAQNTPTVIPHTAGSAFLFVPVVAPGGRIGTVIVYYQAAPASTSPNGAPAGRG